MIEAVLLGQELPPVAEMPLTDGGRRVTTIAEGFGEGDFISG